MLVRAKLKMDGHLRWRQAGKPAVAIFSRGGVATLAAGRKIYRPSCATPCGI